MSRTITEFTVLPAFNGDSILVKTFSKENKEFIVLVDGGTAQTFKKNLKKEIEGLCKIDILILSHIDSDHIGGLINFFKSSLTNKIDIGEIWMNHPDLIEITTGSDISVKQGDSFKELIEEQYPNTIIKNINTNTEVGDYCGIGFTILSPTPEIVRDLYEKWEKVRNEDNTSSVIEISDQVQKYAESLKVLSNKPFHPDKKITNDLFNASSIAFIMECPDVSLLLLSDSRSEVIQSSLMTLGYTQASPLPVDYIKLSHHGSLNNTSQELLELVESENFIISTNGGTSTHKHPSRETIARIVYRKNQKENHPTTIYFNYNIEDIKGRIGEFIRDEDFKENNWQVEFRNNFKKE